LPSPLKSAASTTRYPPPGLLGVVSEAEINVTPFMRHTVIVPAAFWNTRSCFPSALKSALPTKRKPLSGLFGVSAADDTSTSLFMNHAAKEPSSSWKIRSDFPSGVGLKSSGLTFGNATTVTTNEVLAVRDGFPESLTVIVTVAVPLWPVAGLMITFLLPEFCAPPKIIPLTGTNVGFDEAFSRIRKPNAV